MLSRWPQHSGQSRGPDSGSLLSCLLLGIVHRLRSIIADEQVIRLAIEGSGGAKRVETIDKPKVY